MPNKILSPYARLPIGLWLAALLGGGLGVFAFAPFYVWPMALASLAALLALWHLTTSALQAPHGFRPETRIKYRAAPGDYRLPTSREGDTALARPALRAVLREVVHAANGMGCTAILHKASRKY